MLETLRFAVGLLTMVLLAIGCVSVQVREFTQAGWRIDPGEGITVLLHYHSRQPSAVAREAEAREVEDEIVGCVAGVIRTAHPTVRIVSPEEFRRAAFPDLSPQAAPRSPEYLSLLLNHPVFRERIAPLNIRYLIAVGGETVQTGDVAAAGGPGAAVIIGVWARGSRLAAAVLDLKEARSEKVAEAMAGGVGMFMFPLPIVIPTPTEGRACQDLGERVAQFLSGVDHPRR